MRNLVVGVAKWISISQLVPVLFRVFRPAGIEICKNLEQCGLKYHAFLSLFKSVGQSPFICSWCFLGLLEVTYGKVGTGVVIYSTFLGNYVLFP